MPTYRWKYAHDWLREQVNNGSIGTDELLDLIDHACDQDEIQNHFGSEMDKDGFFEDLDDDDGRQFTYYAACVTPVDRTPYATKVTAGISRFLESAIDEHPEAVNPIWFQSKDAAFHAAQDFLKNE